MTGEAAGEAECGKDGEGGGGDLRKRWMGKECTELARGVTMNTYLLACQCGRQPLVRQQWTEVGSYR